MLSDQETPFSFTSPLEDLSEMRETGRVVREMLTNGVEGITERCGYPASGGAMRYCETGPRQEACGLWVKGRRDPRLRPRCRRGAHSRQLDRRT